MQLLASELPSMSQPSNLLSSFPVETPVPKNITPLLSLVVVPFIVVFNILLRLASLINDNVLPD